MKKTRKAWFVSVIAAVTAACVSGGADLPPCSPGNAGLELPEGFCAIVVADSVGPARHLTVAGNGDVFVAVTSRSRNPDSTTTGFVLVLRDTDGDGVADEQTRFGAGRLSDVKFHDGYLYYSTATDIYRHEWEPGAREPAGEPELMVSGLPGQTGHWAKSLAFGSDGEMYVNIGSMTNSCQIQDRQNASPGHDPCTELEQQAGVWVFDADTPEQTQADGRRFATGLRNTVALAVRSADGKLYGAMHGRDQLLQNWGTIFDQQQSAEKPAEEFVLLEDGDDFGWPYCYFDPELKSLVLAPEYGGDGITVGRCEDKKNPLIGFPAHWAPNGMNFYEGGQFPAAYRGGAFLVFHGSWNRAPEPQGGYNVVFVPFGSDGPSGEWDVFATGFATDPPTTAGPNRPVGVAEGPDGSIYLTDDRGGRIYRIVYQGS